MMEIMNDEWQAMGDDGDGDDEVGSRWARQAGQLLCELQQLARACMCDQCYPRRSRNHLATTQEADPFPALLEFEDGQSFNNPAKFYSDYVPTAIADENEFHYVEIVHGDLNGDNIIVDGHNNIWVWERRGNGGGGGRGGLRLWVRADSGGVHLFLKDIICTLAA